MGTSATVAYPVASANAPNSATVAGYSSIQNPCTVASCAGRSRGPKSFEPIRNVPPRTHLIGGRECFTVRALARGLRGTEQSRPAVDRPLGARAEAFSSTLFRMDTTDAVFSPDRPALSSNVSEGCTRRPSHSPRLADPGLRDVRAVMQPSLPGM